MSKNLLNKTIFIHDSAEIGKVIKVDENGRPSLAVVKDDIIDITDKAFTVITLVMQLIALIRKLLKG